MSDYGTRTVGHFLLWMRGDWAPLRAGAERIEVSARRPRRFYSIGKELGRGDGLWEKKVAARMLCVCGKKELPISSIQDGKKDFFGLPIVFS